MEDAFFARDGVHLYCVYDGGAYLLLAIVVEAQAILQVAKGFTKHTLKQVK